MTPRAAVFDTNILIEYTKDVERSVKAVQECGDRMISLITWIEFLAGFPDRDQDRPRAFLQSNFNIIPPDEDICDLIIQLRRQRIYKLPDATIYATAKVFGVPLITLNKKDFKAKAGEVHII
jgi:predicted nucleic acid-binding protein